MWIFTTYGFYSVASADADVDSDGVTDPDPVMIRARCRSHLENLQGRFKELSGCQILEWPGRDYRFRIIVGKKTWAAVIADLAREQTWSNFKNKVASSLSGDHEYIHSLHDVWSVMRKLQDASLTDPNPKFKLVFEEELKAVVWDGVSRPESPTDEGGKLRQNLANHAKAYDWPKVLAILAEHPELVNSTRPGGHSLYAPLHQAAHCGASLEVVTELLRRGAWRSLRNSEGDRAVEIARKKAHTHLLTTLTPVQLQDVPAAVLSGIQHHFHDVIRGRAAQWVDEHDLRLPELEVMLGFYPRKFWFRVPGMYGGFAFWLAYDGPNAKLIAESWCRVCGGSGQRHEITASGSRLVDEGFV